MPAWIITLLVNLALKFGWNWLVQKFPWLPKEVKDIIQQVVDATQRNAAAPGMTKPKLAGYKAFNKEQTKILIADHYKNKSARA